MSTDESRNRLRPLLDYAATHVNDHDQVCEERRDKVDVDQIRNKKSKRCGLFLMYVVLATQWILMTYAVSFFPQSTPGRSMSYALQGWVLASFPLGTVVVSPFISRLMHLLGNRRTVVIGITCMGILILAFGLVPLMVGTEDNAVVFIVIGFLYGGFSALGEMGAYAMVTQVGTEDHKVSLYISIAEAVTGAGAMVGPFIGGIIYDQLKYIKSVQLRFFLPFAAISVLPAAVATSVLYLLPNELHVRCVCMNNYVTLP